MKQSGNSEDEEIRAFKRGIEENLNGKDEDNVDMKQSTTSEDEDNVKWHVELKQSRSNNDNEKLHQSDAFEDFKDDEDSDFDQDFESFLSQAA